MLPTLSLLWRPMQHAGSPAPVFPSMAVRSSDRERVERRMSSTASRGIDLQEGKTMSDSNPEKNKAIVLEAFDTLFNKRDYTGAERFWSPKYIQHSAHIETG